MKSSETKPIVIIDYGMGNLASVQSALNKLGVPSVITHDVAAIRSAPGLILPGVGAFGRAMENLQARGLVSVIRDRVLKDRTPLFGICLGMQLLGEVSYEQGKHAGLALVPGSIELIDSKAGTLQVPHVGWNDVQTKAGSPIYTKTPPATNFYFDHSYHFATEPRFISATVEYGSRLVASIESENIFGVQYHPEKSQRAGLWVLRKFTDYVAGKPC